MTINPRWAAVGILSLCLTLSTPAYGQWFRDGVRTPDQPWSKSRGDFGAMLLLSNAPDEFLDNWSRRTPGVSIRTTRTAHRGVPLAPFILFVGCTENTQEICDASFDLQVLRPDGSEFFQTTDLELWRGKRGPTLGTLGLGVGYTEIDVAADDPLGRYLVRANIRDTNAEISFSLEQSFNVFGTVSTVIGTGEAGRSDDQVNNPYGVVIGPDGALYFCDLDNQMIRRRDPETGETTVIAGNGVRGYGGDGDSATDAMLNMPHEIQFDADGDLYIVERDNHVVRKVDMQTGVISTVAGTGEAGFSGDGGPATSALLQAPHSIVFHPDGRLIICDIGNHRLRIVDSAGVITTFGGTGTREPTPNGAPLNGTPLNGPRAMALDPAGNLYLALREGNAIYRIDLTAETIHHVAGTGEQGYTGDGGSALEATLAGPKGLAYAPDGALYIADTENHVIRRINVNTGIITTALGTGERGDGPEPEPRQCKLNRPHGIWIDATGALYVGDSEAHRIRIVK